MSLSLKSHILFIFTILSCALLICLIPKYAAGEELEEPIIPSCPDEDLDKVIDFATVEQNNISDKKIELIIKNNGEYQIRNWSVSFNANFEVKSISGAELVSKKYVVQFKYLPDNSIINPGGSITVSLLTTGGDKNIEFFRVYAACAQLPVEYLVNDCITHDCITGEEKLIIAGNENDFHSENQNKEGSEAESSITEGETLQLFSNQGTTSDIPTFENEFSLNLNAVGIFGKDNRIKVSNVNTGIYRSIGRLVTRFQNRWVSSATAFMISNSHALTAAHTVWAKINNEYRESLSGNIRFGENGTKAQRVINIRYWNIDAAYKTHPVVANDWVCLTLQYPVNRGYFKLRVVRPFNLMKYKVGTAGYPIMKATTYKGQKFYKMFKTSGYLTNVGTRQLAYKMDTTKGQSGSPIYTVSGSILFSRKYVVGIACTINEETNYGCYLNASRISFFNRMGWCG